MQNSGITSSGHRKVRFLSKITTDGPLIQLHCTSLAEDTLVMKDETNPTYMWGTGISEIDGKYLELTISKDTAPVQHLFTILIASV